MISNLVYSDYQPINCEIKLHPFLLGIARLFDFFGVLNQPSAKKGTEIDMEAMKSDWQAVGFDINTILSDEELDDKLQ
jgi:hypothetical protein